MGRFVGRLELEELAERVDRGVVPAGTLLELRDPREHGQVVLGEVLAEPDGPVGISVIGQWLAAIELACDDEVVEVVDALTRIAHRRREGGRVDPQVAGRTEADGALAKDQHATAGVVGRTERRPSSADRLVEVVRCRLEGAVWPELLHQRLAVKPVARREGEDPDQLASLPQAPCRP